MITTTLRTLPAHFQAEPTLRKVRRCLSVMTVMPMAAYLCIVPRSGREVRLKRGPGQAPMNVIYTGMSRLRSHPLGYPRTQSRVQDVRLPTKRRICETPVNGSLTVQVLPRLSERAMAVLAQYSIRP